MNDEINKYYVYAYLDPRKPGKYIYGEYSFDYEPFYIGKGNGRRILDHFKPSEINKKTIKSRKIKKIINNGMCPIFIKIKEFLTEEESFSLEKNIISKIGRINLKTGCLANLDDGGFGCSGKIMSENAKYKISINNAKYWKGKHHSEETKIKLSIKNKKQDFSYRFKKYILTNPEGEEILVQDGLQKFCDRYNLNRRHLIDVAKGKRNHSKGWKCKIPNTSF